MSNKVDYNNLSFKDLFWSYTNEHKAYSLFNEKAMPGFARRLLALTPIQLDFLLTKYEARVSSCGTALDKANREGCPTKELFRRLHQNKDRAFTLRTYIKARAKLSNEDITLLREKFA